MFLNESSASHLKKLFMKILSFLSQQKRKNREREPAVLTNLAHLQVDKLAYKEQEVSLLVKLGRLEEGEKLYKTLLAINPDNYR